MAVTLGLANIKAAFATAKATLSDSNGLNARILPPSPTSRVAPIQRTKPSPARNQNEAKKSGEPQPASNLGPAAARRTVRRHLHQTLAQMLRATLPNYFTHNSVFTVQKKLYATDSQFLKPRPSPHNSTLMRPTAS